MSALDRESKVEKASAFKLNLLSAEQLLRRCLIVSKPSQRNIPCNSLTGICEWLLNFNKTD